MRILAIALLMTGCASSGSYKDYLSAQEEANKNALREQKPMVEIIAVDGQPITGLKALRVYAPQSAPVIQQERPNEWAGVITQGLGIAGTIGTIYYGGKAMTSIAGEVRQAGTVGYSHVQAPTTTTTTTTLSGTGVLGNGSYTSNPSTNTLSGTGVIGTGIYDTSTALTGTGVIGSGGYQTATPTIVLQPPPVIVNQPAPIIVQP